jgi:LuxR family transcriptional regulator, quorum-sensing system regulator BjaR1
VKQRRTDVANVSAAAAARRSPLCVSPRDGARQELDETLTFIRRIDRACNAQEVCDVVLKAVRPYGFRHVLAGTIPLPGSSTAQQVANIVLAQWPAGWAERYFSNGYLFVDPAIRRVTSDISPFQWNELAPLCRHDPMATRVMDEAGDFQLKYGFTVPLVTLEGDIAGFSIAGPRVELPPRSRGMLSLIATYAFGHALNLRIKKSDALEARITSREQEILQWAAAGKTEWEIGEILNISEHTVDKFFRTARSKLGAINRTQAVAEAFRRNIIS